MDFETMLGLMMLGIGVVMWIAYRLSYKISYASNRRKRYVQPPRKGKYQRGRYIRHKN